jgi:hypothetical protein
MEEGLNQKEARNKKVFICSQHYYMENLASINNNKTTRSQGQECLSALLLLL